MRARPVAPARRKPGPKDKDRKVPPARGGMDLHHALSALVGGYVGLVFYSLVTPGQIVHAPAIATPDPRSLLAVAHVKATPEAGGWFSVTGKVMNSRDRECSLAKVTVKFTDGQGREVNHTFALVEHIPAGGQKAFEVRSLAAGAVACECTPDTAVF